MTYLNGSPNISRTPRYMRATPEQRGTWFSLWCYCHEMENGGIIDDCKDWPDNMWNGIQAVPIIVLSDSPLWRFNGTSLVVQFYDLEAEAAYLRKKKDGAKYAFRRWEKKNRPDDGLPNGLPNGSPIDLRTGKKSA